jgi:hypothetical protein
MRIFRPKRKKAAGDWRRLYSEEFHTLYASPNREMHIYIEKEQAAWDLSFLFSYSI